MSGTELRAVITRIGSDNFTTLVHNAVGGEWEPLERLVVQFSPSDPFRQELRKAVRWCVENGRGEA